MRRRTLLAAPALLTAPAIVRAESQNNGVALVIGNSKYKWEASLPNVKRDAPDIAKRFEALGLKTELVQDTGRDAMRAAVDKFGTAARGANLAAFYFAGHGASWDKDTYLVPEDADLNDPNTVSGLLSVSAISVATKDARHRLLVFDNCRNNPADGWRQKAAVTSSQISRVEQAAALLNGPDTLVLFSTAPGRVAVDGPAGENSPFAAAFLRQLATPAIDFQTLPAKLRRDLLVATGGRQVLWDQSTYSEDFVLNNPRGGAPASARPSPDGSRIVELDKAYTFAREQKLLLPAGLVALRPQNGSPDGPKIGSFKTTTRVNVGHDIYGRGIALEPLLLIVVSVIEGNTAEIVFSTRDWATIGGPSGGYVWRYSTARLSGSSLEFTAPRPDRNNGATLAFKWSDADSGTHTSLMVGVHHSPFARLDG